MPVLQTRCCALLFEGIQQPSRRDRTNGRFASFLGALAGLFASGQARAECALRLGQNPCVNQLHRTRQAALKIPNNLHRTHRPAVGLFSRPFACRWPLRNPVQEHGGGRGGKGSPTGQQLTESSRLFGPGILVEAGPSYYAKSWLATAKIQSVRQLAEQARGPGRPRGGREERKGRRSGQGPESHSFPAQVPARPAGR